MSTYAPFAKPLYVMLKPVGAVCNLACDYCYYLEKSKLYRDNPKHVMSEELLEKFIRTYLRDLIKFAFIVREGLDVHEPAFLISEFQKRISRHGPDLFRRLVSAEFHA